MPIHMGHRSYIHQDDYRNTFDGHVHIGKFTSIARGVCFLCGPGASHASVDDRRHVSNYPFFPSNVSKPIRIGSDCWIGTQAILLPGITIGDGATIGAGAVVSKDVGCYEVVVGSPARIVKKRFTDEIIAKLLDIRWWDWPDKQIDEAIPLFCDIDAFVEKYRV